MKKEVNATHGVTFCGLLQIAFIVLKLIGKINWSWWVVLLPSYIGLAIVLAILIVAITVVIVRDLVKDKRR